MNGINWSLGTVSVICFGIYVGLLIKKWTSLNGTKYGKIAFWCGIVFGSTASGNSFVAKAISKVSDSLTNNISQLGDKVYQTSGGTVAGGGAAIVIIIILVCVTIDMLDRSPTKFSIFCAPFVPTMLVIIGLPIIKAVLNFI